MNDSNILFTVILASGVLLLIVILLLIRRRDRNKVVVNTPPISNLPEQPPMANMTRVLPVGMLIAKAGANRGLVFSVDPSGVKIGRDKDKNQIVINDPIVSREHAWIGLDDGKVIIKDENSRNGTYINTLDTPRIISQELKDGDVIYIGKKGSESFKYKTG